MIKVKKLSILLMIALLFSLSFVMSGCNDEDTDRIEWYNYYDGGLDEFEFSNWNSGVADQVFTIDSNEAGETVVAYNKFGTNEWPQIVSKVVGESLSDFSYLNFTMRASKSMIMEAQIVFFLDDSGEQSGQTSIIGEVPFNVSTQNTTFSYRISDSKRLMLDLIEDVWLFPEPGSAGSNYIGNFTINRSWFSKTMPQDSQLVNAGGDSDGTSYPVPYGPYWTNESSWTKYNLGVNSFGEVDVSFTSAAAWAMITRKLTDYDVSHNMLKFEFINRQYGAIEGPSIEHIRFILRGDKKEIVTEPTYSYWTYHEVILDYQYILDPENTNTTDTVTCLMNISSAASTLMNHRENGLNLTIYIESVPFNELGGNITFNKNGTMSITKVETFADEEQPNYYNGSGYTTTDKYMITTNTQNTVMTVEYDFAPNNSQNIVYEFAAKSAGGEYHMSVRNDSDHAISVMLNYKISGVDGSGAQELVIESGESQTLSVSFLEGTTAIILFIDSTSQRSGEVGGKLTITNYGFSAT